MPTACNATRIGFQPGWLQPAFLRHVLQVLVLFALLPSVPSAQQTSAEDLEYSREGADSCLACHDESEAFPVLDIFKTRHGHRGDSRSPFGSLQCEACHGPGGAHSGRVRRGAERPGIPLSGNPLDGDPDRQDAMCVDCHDGGHTAQWDGSVHQVSGVGCVDCHQVHTLNDPVMDSRDEATVCYECHLKQRSDSLKTSSHPIRYGTMACSDCHQPHDSSNDASLLTSTVNETCYTCHAEKRGPRLWEHPPVEEDCGLCHRAHGSNHLSLLTSSGPLLCQQCHSRAGHPELALTGNELPGRGGNFSALLVARGCANCHSQVHGSNHPSGVNLTR